MTPEFDHVLDPDLEKTKNKQKAVLLPLFLSIVPLVAQIYALWTFGPFSSTTVSVPAM